MPNFTSGRNLLKLRDWILGRFATKESVYTRDEMEIKLTEVAEREHDHDDRYYTEDESDGRYIKRVSFEYPINFGDGGTFTFSNNYHTEDMALYKYTFVKQNEYWIKSFTLDFSDLINNGRKIIAYRASYWKMEDETIGYTFDNSSKFTFNCTSQDKFGTGTRVYLYILWL